ncbi:MAG: acyl carrier protein [Proteobacteria bacterium]|nr:acyl carrier protein [Pseudomonadota bacterium]
MDQEGAVIWTPEGVLDEIRSLLEPYNPNGVEISLETDFSSELNIDSVAAMNLVMEIEDKFAIDIPINQLPDMNTPKDLVDIVLVRVNK